MEPLPREMPKKKNTVTESGEKEKPLTRRQSRKEGDASWWF